MNERLTQAETAPPNGTTLPDGGKLVTAEQKAQVFERRERSVELYALGYSYAEISKKTGVAWQTAYADVQRHLEFTAKYFQATKFREQIAATYRATIKKAEKLHNDLGDAQDFDSLTIRLKALAQIDRGATSLARLYGLINEDPMVLANVHITPGQGLLGSAPEWAKDMDPERVKELRETIIKMYRDMNPKVVDAEFTLDEKEPAKAESQPTAQADPPDGPVTMSGA